MNVADPVFLHCSNHLQLVIFRIAVDFLEARFQHSLGPAAEFKYFPADSKVFVYLFQFHFSFPFITVKFSDVLSASPD